jgi:hypothetical protein
MCSDGHADEVQTGVDGVEHAGADRVRVDWRCAAAVPGGDGADALSASERADGRTCVGASDSARRGLLDLDHCPLVARFPVSQWRAGSHWV